MPPLQASRLGDTWFPSDGPAATAVVNRHGTTDDYPWVAGSPDTGVFDPFADLMLLSAVAVDGRAPVSPVPTEGGYASNLSATASDGRPLAPPSATVGGGPAADDAISPPGLYPMSMSPPAMSPPSMPPAGSGGLTAGDDSYTTVHDRLLFVSAADGVLANDTDPAGADLFALLTNGPTHGGLTYQSADLSFDGGAGGFYYTPDPLFVGTDTFTYKASNGTAVSNEATVTILVTNNAPVAVADAYTTSQDSRLLVANPHAGAGDITAGATGAGTTLVTTTDNTLLANDTDGDTGTGGEGVEGSPGGGAANSTGDILRTIQDSGPSHGQLAFYDDGSFLYTPDANYHGSDSFTYHVTDGVVSSCPVTVSLTVQLARGLDLDGRDSTSGGQWMREWEESRYGLGVGLGDPAELLARQPLPPTADPGWQLVSRSLTWNASWLSVGGSSSGSLGLSLGGGDEALAIAAVADLMTAPLGAGTVYYWAGWLNGALGVGVYANAQIQAGPKIVVHTVDVTTDQGVLLDQTKDVLSIEGAAHYPAVEVDMATGRFAPITHERNKPFTMKVVYSTAGIPANCVITGLVHSNLPTAPGSVTLPYPATNTTATVTPGNTSDILGGYNVGFIWSATVVNQGTGASTQLGLATYTQSVFLTAGTPVGTDIAYRLPTVARFLAASPAIIAGYAKAREKVSAGLPLPHQIVYEVLNQHKFNLGNGINGDEGRAWLVPRTWNAVDPTLNPNGRGMDCISGATFTDLACNLYGLPGNISHIEYTSKSEAEFKIAIPWTVAVQFDAAHRFPSPFEVDPAEYLTLWDKHGAANFFESCVRVTYNNTTYLFASGAEGEIYTNPNHVLTIFKTCQRSRNIDGKHVRVATRPVYTLDPRAPSLNIY